jgi:hypothetical protein
MYYNGWTTLEVEHRRVLLRRGCYTHVAIQGDAPAGPRNSLQFPATTSMRTFRFQPSGILAAAFAIVWTVTTLPSAPQQGLNTCSAGHIGSHPMDDHVRVTWYRGQKGQSRRAFHFEYLKIRTRCNHIHNEVFACAHYVIEGNDHGTCPLWLW